MGLNFADNLKGLRRVPYSDLRFDIFPNPRKSNTSEAIANLRDAIDKEGLIHPPTLGRLPDGTEGIAAGFSRCHAIMQLAVLPIFNEINKANGTTSKKDAGYLDVSLTEHQAKVKELKPEEWAKALRETMIPVAEVEVKNATEAALIGFMENYNRTVMTPLDTVNQIIGLTSGPDALKAKTVASNLGCGEARISQWRRVGEGIQQMRIELVTPDQGETFSEAELAELKNTVKLCVDDYMVRLGLSSDDPQAIDFTSARNLTYHIFPGGKNAKKPSRKNMLRALQHLLGWSFVNNTLPDNRKTPETSMWQQLIEADAKMEKDAAAAAAAGEATPEGEAVSGEEATAETPVGEVSGTAAGTAAAAEANTQAAAVPAGEAAPAAAAGATSTATTPAAQTEVPTDNAPPTTRQTKAGQSMPDANKYAKRYTDERIELLADHNFKHASDTDYRVGENLASLWAASALYESLGLADKQKAVDDVTDQLAEELEEYVGSLEKIAKAAVAAGLPVKGVNVKSLFDGNGNPLRPVFVNEGETEGDDETADEEAEAEAEAVAST